MKPEALKKLSPFQLYLVDWYCLIVFADIFVYCNFLSNDISPIKAGFHGTGLPDLLLFQGEANWQFAVLVQSFNSVSVCGYDF